MKIPVNGITRRFWEFVGSKKKQYPHWVLTAQELPRPEMIPMRASMYGHFVRMPVTYGDGGLEFKKAAWGFSTREYRDKFVIEHPNAEVWQL